MSKNIRILTAITVILLFIEIVAAPFEWFWPKDWGGTTYWSSKSTGQSQDEIINQKKIALTFDDGPSAYTSVVLDILYENQAHGSFFVMGQQAELFPHLVERMAEEGHDIENHAYDFVAQGNKFWSGMDTSKIAKTSEIIKKLSGKEPQFYRSPGGQMGRPLYNAIREQNLYVVNGVLPMPHPKYDAEKQLSIIRQTIKPGAIIVLHDGDDQDPNSDRPKATVELLPVLLGELKQQGYQMVSLSELLKDVEGVK